MLGRDLYWVISFTITAHVNPVWPNSDLVLCVVFPHCASWDGFSNLTFATSVLLLGSSNGRLLCFRVQPARTEATPSLIYPLGKWSVLGCGCRQHFVLLITCLVLLPQICMSDGLAEQANLFWRYVLPITLPIPGITFFLSVWKPTHMIPYVAPELLGSTFPFPWTFQFATP